MARHGAAVRSALASQASAYAATNAGRQKTDSRLTVPFDVLFSEAAVGRDAMPEIPAHLAVEWGDGRVEEFVLALTLLDPVSAAARTGGDTYVVLDPSRFYDEQSVSTVEATSLTTGEVVEAALVEDDEVLAVVEGDPDSDIAVVEAISVVQFDENLTAFGDQEYYDSLIPPHCDEPDIGRSGCGSSGSGGSGGSGGGTNPPQVTTTYLTLRSLRVSDNLDRGSAEIQMHLQKGDDFGRYYSKYNNLRFDYHKVYGWENYPDHPTGDTFGGAKSWNPVPLPALDRLRWYDVPDVNYDDRDYSFTDLEIYDDISGLYPGVPSYFQGPFEEAGGLPLVPLTDDNAHWRGIMTEDDGEVDRLRRPSDNWRGDVHTYDFQTGQYNRNYTRMRAQDCGLACPFTEDDIFTGNAFRRANYDNAFLAGNLEAARDGNRMRFGVKTVALPPAP